MKIPFAVFVVLKPNKTDKKLRWLLRYNNKWYTIFWLQVKKDGSVYLGPRYDSVVSMKKGSKQTEGNQTTISYTEGEPIVDPQVLNNQKISFHSSGTIHSGGEKLFSESLRTLKSQRELCRVLFAHPSNYATTDAIREHDITNGIEIDEKRPLQAIIFISPKNDTRPVTIPLAEWQFTELIPFTGLQNAPDIFLQIALFQQAEFRWPDSTYIFFGIKTVKTGKK